MYERGTRGQFQNPEERLFVKLPGHVVSLSKLYMPFSSAQPALRLLEIAEFGRAHDPMTGLLAPVGQVPA